MNNLNAANESNPEALSLLEQMGQFELTPCDSAYDFEDKSRFTKLSLSEAQKMLILPDSRKVFPIHLPHLGRADMVP